MSSPACYAWHEYPLIVEVTSSNGNIYRFLCRYKTQDEIIETITNFLLDRGRHIVFIKAETLLEESYDLLAVHFNPEYILE